MKEKTHMKKREIITALILVSAFLFAVSTIAQQKVAPVNFRKLLPFLGDVPGFTPDDKPEGQTVTMGELSYTIASRSYSSEDKSLTISIYHGPSMAPPYIAFQQMKNFQVDSSEELIKSIEIKGFPAIEHYTYEDKDATVMILLKEHLLVVVEEEEAEDIEETVKIAKSLPLEKIANAVN
jgi:hypothetical protein